MSGGPVSTGQQREFCDIEGWAHREGSGHEVRSLVCPDGTTLRTTISRSYKEFSGQMKANILRQLAVDEATFREVLNTRRPPVRPAPVETKPHAHPAHITTQLKKAAYFTDDEITQLTKDEAQHLFVVALEGAKTETARERRQRLDAALASYRSDQ
jgi:hypothetical protein